MLVGGVVVEDPTDGFAGQHLGFDRIEEADKLLREANSVVVQWRL
jgi:hypothetical protein